MPRKPMVGRPLSIIMSAEDNIARYLNQPTVQKVESVIKYMRINKQMAEKLFGIPAGMLRQYTGGFRKTLPAQYWHIFFEIKKIRYMVKHGLTTINAPVNSPARKKLPKPKKKTIKVSKQNKSRLNEYRAILES